MAREDADLELQMTSQDLYREETFTDRKVGTLQRLIPVTAAGETDPNRATVYMGQSQLMTPAGALPISFEIDARSLKEAAEKFGDHAERAVGETMERLEEMRREAASSITLPGAGPGGAGSFGGAGGGGKFHIP